MYAFALVLTMLVIAAVPLALRGAGLDEPATWLLGEDGIYETVGALAALAGGLTLIYVLVRLGRSHTRNPWYLILALLLIILFGEEISWGKRLVGWSPLAADIDSEQTLHNLPAFRTAAQGNLAVLGLYAALVFYLGVLPAAARLLPGVRRLGNRWLIPLPSKAIAAALWAALLGFIVSLARLHPQEAGEVWEACVELLLLVLALEIYRAARVESRAAGRRELPVLLGVVVLPLGLVLGYHSLRDREPLVSRDHYAGDTLLDAGQWSAAAAHYQAALALRPHDARALTKLGYIHLQQEDFSTAGQYLEEALNVAPQRGDAHFLLGVVRTHEDRLEDAARHLQTAFDLDPRRSDALLMLGMVRLGQDRLDEAQRALERVIELEPENMQARQYLFEIRSRR